MTIINTSVVVFYQWFTQMHLFTFLSCVVLFNCFRVHLFSLLFSFAEYRLLFLMYTDFRVWAFCSLSFLSWHCVYVCGNSSSIFSYHRTLFFNCDLYFSCFYLFISAVTKFLLFLFFCAPLGSASVTSQHQINVHVMLSGNIYIETVYIVCLYQIVGEHIYTGMAFISEEGDTLLIMVEDT